MATTSTPEPWLVDVVGAQLQGGVRPTSAKVGLASDCVRPNLGPAEVVVTSGKLSLAHEIFEPDPSSYYPRAGVQCQRNGIGLQRHVQLRAGGAPWMCGARRDICALSPTMLRAAVLSNATANGDMRGFRRYKRTPRNDSQRADRSDDRIGTTWNMRVSPVLSAVGDLESWWGDVG